MINEREMCLLRRIRADRAFGHLEKITRLGIRTAGGQAASETDEYISDHLASLGLSVSAEPFAEQCFSVGEYGFEIESPSNVTINCLPMMFSSPAPGAGVTGGLIYANRGRESDYEGLDVSGQIVLIDRDPHIETDTYYREVKLAGEKGAVGLVLVNFQPWAFIGTLESALFDPARRFLPLPDDGPPSVCISSEDGGRLKERLQAGPVKARLKIEAETKSMPLNNIRGLIPGQRRPDKRIVICAHLDSEANCGANDNGSGLGIMLELAGVFVVDPPDVTVEFLAVNGEEISIMGSHHYCQRHRDDLKDIICVLNIDMVGVGDKLGLVTRGGWPDQAVTYPQWLNTMIFALARELGHKLNRLDCPLGTSDEGNFLAAGVPAAFFWNPDDTCYHSPLDRPERVDPNNLQAVAEIVALTVMRLADQVVTADRQEIYGDRHV